MTPWRVIVAIAFAATACASPASSLPAPSGTAVAGRSSPTVGPSTAAPTTAAPTPIPTQSGCVEDGAELRYQSDGTTVRGALFRPQASGPAPAVLVLHTRGGLGSHELTEASWYASQGFVAYAPDYFTPVGVTPLTFDRLTFAALYTNAVVDHLVRAADCLGSLSGVDRVRLGAVGYSMGGYIALVLATRPGIVAAAGWYAAYRGAPAGIIPGQQDWSTIAAAVRVPVLLLHGDADTEVQVGAARRAEAELERNGKRSELVVYPGAGHGYDYQSSPPYTYDAAATADSRSRTLALLRAAR